MKLSDVIAEWRLVETDFQSHYHLDLHTCRDRSWRWLRVRIEGLLHDDTTRVWRRFVGPHINQDNHDDGAGVIGDGR